MNNPRRKMRGQLFNGQGVWQYKLEHPVRYVERKVVKRETSSIQSPPDRIWAAQTGKAQIEHVLGATEIHNRCEQSASYRGIWGAACLSCSQVSGKDLMDGVQIHGKGHRDNESKGTLTGTFPKVSNSLVADAG